MNKKINSPIFIFSLPSVRKKAELTTKEILEIILGAAVFLVLAVFLYQLISPNFNKGDETVKSYFNNFKDQVAVADSGGVGSFSIWQPENKQGKREFYLVYFGSSSSYGEGVKFYSLGNNLNTICVCSLEDRDTNCNSCENLKYPVSPVGLSEDDYGRWAIGVGEKIKIVRKGGVYEIRKV